MLNNKRIALFVIIYSLLVTKSWCSGFEYFESILTVTINSNELGIVNFKHISTHELEGKLLLEPLGSISLPCKGHAFIAYVCLLSFSLLLVLFYYVRSKKTQNQGITNR